VIVYGIWVHYEYEEVNVYGHTTKRRITCTGTLQGGGECVQVHCEL